MRKYSIESVRTEHHDEHQNRRFYHLARENQKMVNEHTKRLQVFKLKGHKNTDINTTDISHLFSINKVVYLLIHFFNFTVIFLWYNG